MCQRTIRNVHDEETHRVINEEAEHMLFAAYADGVRSIMGHSTMDQAVRLAVTVDKYKQLTEGAFSTRKDSE
jgi:hypothetical protein